MEKTERATGFRTTSSYIVTRNEDLMVNILSRLTVKALTRFKIVSKQWNMLISDPYFVSSHQDQATNDPDIMKVLWVGRDGLIRLCSIKEEKEERIVDRVSFRPNYPLVGGRITMNGSPCNGLICLTKGDGETLVCNPTTKNTMVIPRGNKKATRNYVQGLGFSSSSNEFKVIRIFERLDVDKSVPNKFHWCELFTIRGAQGTTFLQHSRSWRLIGKLPCRIPYPGSGAMCYVNGSTHWMIEPEVGNSSSTTFILSLDLELEEFKVVSRPEHWAKDTTYYLHMSLKELGGKLCIVDHIIDSQLWDIWVLKDYTNSIWSKEYHVDLQTSDFCTTLCDISVVSVCRGQLLLQINWERLLCHYDPRTNFCEKVIELGASSDYGGVCRYVESLRTPF